MASETDNADRWCIAAEAEQPVLPLQGLIPSVADTENAAQDASPDDIEPQVDTGWAVLSECAGLEAM